MRVALAQIVGCVLLGFAGTRWLGAGPGVALAGGVALVAVPMTAALLVLAHTVSVHADDLALDPPAARAHGHAALVVPTRQLSPAHRDDSLTHRRNQPTGRAGREVRGAAVPHGEAVRRARHARTRG